MGAGYMKPKVLSFLILIFVSLGFVFTCSKENQNQNIEGLNLVTSSSLSPLYVTFEQEDTSTSLTVNTIVKGDVSNLKLYLDDESHNNLSSYKNIMVGRNDFLPSIETTFYHYKLTGLTPGKIYYIRMGIDERIVSDEYKVKTIPRSLEEISAIVGGDMGTEKKIVDIASSAAINKPDFILIGGDIAYVNGDLSKFESWILWFQHMSKVYTTADKELIPLVVAIGNHETTMGSVSFPENKSPMFLNIFPEAKEHTFFRRRFGKDLGLIVLDSGHLVSHKDQVEFLSQSLERYKGLKHRVAAYHAPLYPSHRTFDGGWAINGREYWLPLFDKYSLNLSFEHHDHTLKRSHVLKENQISEKGTVFVGDGCWGKTPRRAESRWYLKTSMEELHVWDVNFTSSGIQLKAKGLNNKVFDELQIKETPKKTIVLD